MANGGIAQVDLVGNSRGAELITSATDKMVEGLRAGFITANDIIERGSERNKAKEKMEIALARQATTDATDPALIEARRNQQLLAGEQAQQTRDLLPTARLATEEKLFGDIRSGQIARYGLKEKLEALNNVGFAPAPENGITAAFATDVERRFNMMTGWQTKKGRAVLALANIDAGEIVGPSGATGRGPTDKQTGAPIPEGQVQQLRKDAAETFTEYLFGIPPGETAATPAAPIAASVIQPAAAPVAAAAPVIQPVVAPAPSVAAPTEFPPGFVQVKPAPVTAESTAGVKRTDALQRELITLDETTRRIAETRNLATKGIVGPDQFGFVQTAHRWGAAFPKLGAIMDWDPFSKEKEPTSAEQYNAQRQISNAIADEIAIYVQDWKGAISNVELQFFKEGRPSIQDTPEVWKAYLDRRERINENVKKVVSGELAPPDPAAWAANPRSTLGAAALGGAPPAAPATPSEAPVFALTEASKQPSGTIFKDAAGNWRRKL